MPFDCQDHNSSPQYEHMMALDDKAFLQNTESYQQKLLKQKVFRSMEGLEGWCTPFKAGILIDLIHATKAEIIVEIGVWGGKSLIPMAFALQDQGRGTIYGIDPWSNSESAAGMDGVNREWWGTVNHEVILQGLLAKIKQFQLNDYIELLRTTSENAPSIPNIDILHIDGNHSEKTSFYDVNKWFPLVKKNGIIVFDDITWPTTFSAVEWLSAHCTKLAGYREDNDWGIWVKN